jgi:hypothetical protein
MSAISEVKERVNINDLNATERKALMKNTFNRVSYFQTLFNVDRIELACEKVARGLREQIDRLLLEKKLVNERVPLEDLYSHLSAEMNTYNFDDGINKISTYFYDTDDMFQAAYYDFIRYIREHYFKEPFWFQITPTIRIHSPNGKNNNHYPRYHSDIGYGHPPEEFNLWLPLTDLLTGHGFTILPVADSTALLKSYDYDFPTMIEAAIDDKAFSQLCDDLSLPVTTRFGDVLAFDSRSIHSGQPMTIHSRASMDIRILPLSQYEKMDIEYQGSGRRRILFTPGHCYHTKNSDQI